MERNYDVEERIFAERHEGLSPKEFAEKMGGIEFAKKQMALFARDEKRIEVERNAKWEACQVRYYYYLENRMIRNLEDCLVFGTPKKAEGLEELEVLLNYYYSVMGRIAEGREEYISDEKAKEIEQRIETAEAEIKRKDEAFQKDLDKYAEIVKEIEADKEAKDGEL